MIASADEPVDTSSQLLAEFGERLRKARLRRRLTATKVAESAGITRVTLRRAENGDAAVSMGTFLRVMAILDLSADIALLARDDRSGRLIQDEALQKRRKGSTVPRRIYLKKYPQLRQIAWSLDPNAELGPTAAFQLYERNWRHVDQASMTAEERQLVAKLTQTIGKGVLLV